MSDGQDLLRQIASAGARLDPRLSDRDVERLVAGSCHRVRRRTLRRVGLLTASAAIVAAAWFAARSPESAKTVAVAPYPPMVAPLSAPDRALHLADGSLATPLDTGSDIALVRQSVAQVELALASGRGRFEVAPRLERTFSVRAGEVTVTVVGTVFTVERIADRVGVAVERGTVRVDWGVGSRLLRQSESGWFPPLQVSVASEPKATRPPRGKLVRPRAQVVMRETESSLPLSARGETAEQLLLEADGARLAGRPERGADLLRRLLREHRGDPRAPLAAFTLGRVLLMELGRPREAAAAFAEVRELSPGGSFAEDALAREVEAWSQAGQVELAHARAQEYLRSYPGGRRATTVRSMGKVE